MVIEFFDKILHLDVVSKMLMNTRYTHRQIQWKDLGGDQLIKCLFWNAMLSRYAQNRNDGGYVICLISNLSKCNQIERNDLRICTRRIR